MGGEISPEQQSVSGHISQEILKNFYVDRAFVSVGGISIETGISDYDMNDSVISKMIILKAKEVIVLADHSKISIQAFCHIAPLESIDVVVCEKDHPEAWAQELEIKGITWINASQIN